MYLENSNISLLQRSSWLLFGVNTSPVDALLHARKPVAEALPVLGGTDRLHCQCYRRNQLSLVRKSATPQLLFDPRVVKEVKGREIWRIHRMAGQAQLAFTQEPNCFLRFVRRGVVVMQPHP